MAEQITPGMYVEVVVKRTVTQEMRIGVTVDDENSAKECEGVALAKAVRCGDNGWEQIEASTPQVTDLNAKGPIVYRERRFRNSGRMKSTGRPAEA